MRRLPRARLPRVFAVLLLAVSLHTVLGGGCTWAASSGGGGHTCKDLDGDGVCDDEGGGTVIIIVDAPPAPDEPGEGVVVGQSGSSPAAAPGVGPLAPAAPAAPWVQSGADPWSLAHAPTEPGLPGWHPVARVADVTGVSLGALWGPGRYGPLELREFSERLRAANPELLGLDDRDGWFEFDGVQWLDTLVAVTWRQRGPAVLELAPDEAHQTFLFDALGALLQIDNHLALPAATP